MKCPQCNAEGTLIISFMHQVSYDYKIKRDGTLPKKHTKSGEYSAEWSSINCLNCGMYTTSKSGDYFNGEDGEIVFKEDKQWTEQLNLQSNAK